MSLIYRRDKGFAVHGLQRSELKTMRLGIVGATPPADLLVRHDLMANAKPYALTVDTRYESPTREMIEDIVRAATIDVGLLWGPIAGYYLKQRRCRLLMVPCRRTSRARRAWTTTSPWACGRTSPSGGAASTLRSLKRQRGDDRDPARLRRAAARRAGPAH